MLIVLLSWMVMTGISFLTGHAFSKLIGRLIGVQSPNSFTLNILCGFSVLSAIGSWISIFSGINTSVFFGLLILCFLWLLKSRKDVSGLFEVYVKRFRQLPALWKIFSFTVLITALCYSAAPTQCYDEGLYYVQAIHWNTYFPVVPGLANLESRLGGNSSWHILATIFNFAFLPSVNFDDLNGLLYIVVMIYALGGVKKILAGEYKISSVLRSFLILPNFLFYFSIMAPAADLAVTYYSWIIFILFLENLEKSQRKIDGNFILLTVFSVYLITLKLSSFTVIPLFLYLAVLAIPKSGIKQLSLPAFIALFIITPWLIRNVILTGFLVYPMAVITFNVDWKVPEQEAAHLRCAVESWAKIAQTDCERLAKMSLKEWFPIWFSAKRVYDKLIFLLLILCSLLSGIFFMIKAFKDIKRVFKTWLGYLILYLTLLASNALWFFKAPDFRFGYAQILCFCIIVIAVIFYRSLLKVSENTAGKILSLCGFGCVFVMLIFLWVLQGKSDFITSYTIIPAALPQPQLQVQRVNSMQIYVPTGTEPQCWGGPLPCSLHSPSPNLHLRTGKLEDGFRIGEK